MIDAIDELKIIAAALRDYIDYLQGIGITQYEAGVRFGNRQQSVRGVVVESKSAAVEPISETKVVKEVLAGESSKALPQAPAQFSLFAQQEVSQREETLEDIKAEIGNCCHLCKGCTQAVFGEGNPNAQLMFIGEAPGAEEDLQGRPFVGQAGKLLDKIIEAMALKRQDVYITNVVKCRPPENRKPEKEEIEACEGFLFREIAVVKPQVIVTLGATPLFSLLRIKDGISRVRGNWYEYKGIPVMPTFHPAYLLRSPDKKREVWEDIKKVMTHLKMFQQ